MMVARTGLPLFRSAKGRRLRLFLRSRDNSVRETNAQPAPVTGLKKGFGERLCQNAMQKVVFMVK